MLKRRMQVTAEPHTQAATCAMIGQSSQARRRIAVFKCLGLLEVDHMRSVGDDYERRAGDACAHVPAHDVGG